jgi:hypothetical protein
MTEWSVVITDYVVIVLGLSYGLERSDAGWLGSSVAGGRAGGWLGFL